MTPEHDLARALVELADAQVSDRAVTDLLHSLVGRCVDLLDICAAGVIVTEPDGHLVLASSADRVRLTDLFQLRIDEGPAVECIRTGIAVTAADLEAARSQWPRFAPAARQHGFAAVHALPLRRREEVIGGLSLLRAHTGELTPEQRHGARALADVTTIAILHRRRLDRAEQRAGQLEGALTSRVVIEQAKGILAATGAMSTEDAFTRLRHHARSNNLRLTQLAGAVVSGAIDPALLLRDRVRPTRPSRSSP